MATMRRTGLSDPWLYFLGAVALAAACEKDTVPTDSPPAEAVEAVQEPRQEEEPRESAGSATLRLALAADETAGFCCDAGNRDSGTDCRRDDNGLDACLQEGYFTFECTGQLVECTDGACTCGADTAAGMLLCCTSVEGKSAHQCQKWSESDYTACEDAGRSFTVCAGEKVCKRTGDDETRFDCTCD
jgi:hypothetical protein